MGERYNYHRVDSEEQVESAVRLMLARIGSHAEKFFAAYDDVGGVLKKFDDGDPELKLLFRENFVSTLISGISAMFEFRGQEAAFELAGRHPEVLAERDGDNIKAVLYQDPNYLMDRYKLPQAPDAKTPRQLLDDASKEFDDFINEALKKDALKKK